MKKIALLVAALAAGFSLRAADEPQSAYSVSLDFPYVSSYVFRGKEYAKDSIQPSLEVTVGGFYGGVWTSQPIAKNYDNEVDLYLGYRKKLNDSLDIDLGATLYCYPELKKSTGQNNTTSEWYVGLNGNVGGFKPGAYAYYDWTLEAWTGQLQLGYSIALPRIGTSIDVTADVGRVSTNNGEHYNYCGFGFNVPYKLNDNATVNAGVGYADSGADGTRKDIIYFTAGITIGF